MDGKLSKDRRVFEVMLIVVVIGLSMLLYMMGGHQMVALNLFFLPVVLSGYYLGRNSAGVVALFCALSATIAVTFYTTSAAPQSDGAMTGLALAVWAAALGLVAILTGTLCDERASTLNELHTAYVGVVEVMSKYLQSADPMYTARSIRVAEFSQRVAKELKLSRKEIDDIRVAALLHDLENVEVTTQVVSNAVNALEREGGSVSPKHTFLGTDLVHSLGAVLAGALPLVVNQDDAMRDSLASEDGGARSDVPIGAKVIRAARAYDDMVGTDSDGPVKTPREALHDLRHDASIDFDADVLNALSRVVQKSTRQVAAPAAAR